MLLMNHGFDWRNHSSARFVSKSKDNKKKGSHGIDAKCHNLIKQFQNLRNKRLKVVSHFIILPISQKLDVSLPGTFHPTFISSREFVSITEFISFCAITSPNAHIGFPTISLFQFQFLLFQYKK